MGGGFLPADDTGTEVPLSLVQFLSDFCRYVFKQLIILNLSIAIVLQVYQSDCRTKQKSVMFLMNLKFQVILGKKKKKKSLKNCLYNCTDDRIGKLPTKQYIHIVRANVFKEISGISVSIVYKFCPCFVCSSYRI